MRTFLCAFLASPIQSAPDRRRTVRCALACTGTAVELQPLRSDRGHCYVLAAHCTQFLPARCIYGVYNFSIQQQSFRVCGVTIGMRRLVLVCDFPCELVQANRRCGIAERFCNQLRRALLHQMIVRVLYPFHESSLSSPFERTRSIRNDNSVAVYEFNC